MKWAVRVIATLAAFLPAPSLLALHFRDGPPARVTGGFGEDSCLACHSGKALNEAGGRLTLSGFPEMYVRGAMYELELEMSRPPKLASAGFQLTIRFAEDRTQAGTIRLSAGVEPCIGLLDERGIQFAHHRLAEVAPPGADSVRWNSLGMPPSAPGKSPFTPRPSRATATTRNSATPCTRWKRLACPSDIPRIPDVAASLWCSHSN